MKYIYKYIYDEYVNENIVNSFNAVLDSCIKNNIRSGPTATYEGFQTPNVIEKIGPSILEDLSKYFSDFLLDRSNFYHTDDVFIDHIHLIQYYKGGLQNAHDHFATEDYSFILYLNDADGDTKFHVRDEIINSRPEKGKLLIFDSFIWHSGEVSNEGKRVAVGALRVYNKRWPDRY